MPGDSWYIHWDHRGRDMGCHHQWQSGLEGDGWIPCIIIITPITLILFTLIITLILAITVIQIKEGKWIPLLAFKPSKKSNDWDQPTVILVNRINPERSGTIGCFNVVYLPQQT